MSCCGAGFSAGKFIAVIVAVGLGGFAAFNYATSGSLCGSCEEPKDTAAAVQGVAAESGEPCPMGACSDKATEVAHAGAACTGEKTGCSTEMAACTGAEAAMVAGACEGEKTCPMTGETVLEAAATEAKTGACGKVCGGEGCDPAACGGCADKDACDKDACDKPAEEVATNDSQKSNG